MSKREPKIKSKKNCLRWSYIKLSNILMLQSPEVTEDSRDSKNRLKKKNN
jgi:hypothetical protein